MKQEKTILSLLKDFLTSQMIKNSEKQEFDKLLGTHKSVIENQTYAKIIAKINELEENKRWKYGED